MDTGKRSIVDIINSHRVKIGTVNRAEDGDVVLHLLPYPGRDDAGGIMAGVDKSCDEFGVVFIGQLEVDKTFKGIIGKDV